MEIHSLDAAAVDQLDTARTASSGRAAETVYGGHGGLRHTVLALTAGSALAEHESPGEATLLVLQGQIRLSTPQSACDGHRGDLIIVPPVRHSLLALTDAAVLLTVAK